MTQETDFISPNIATEHRLDELYFFVNIIHILVLTDTEQEDKWTDTDRGYSLDIRVFKSSAQGIADLPYFTHNSIGKSNISRRQIWKPWAKVLDVQKNCEYNKSTENQNAMLISPKPASPGFPWVNIVSIFLFNISKLVHFGFTFLF